MEYYVVDKTVCPGYVLTWKMDYDIIFSEETEFQIVYIHIHCMIITM